MDNYFQSKQGESRALRVLADNPLVLDFSDAPLERRTTRTPLPVNVWCEQPAPAQSQRGRIDRATPKTQILRQMRAED